MVSFWDTLRTVALAACLVLLILNLELYLEHGYVPLPKTGVVGRLVSRIFHWKIHLIFHWALYWLFHWIFYIPSIIAKIRMKCNLQLCGYRMYARYWFYELRLFRHTHTDLIISIAILALYVILGLALWYLWVQEGSLRGIVSASLSYCIKVVRFVPERLGIISPSSDVEEAYDVNESYGDPKVLTTGLITDLKSIGLKAGRKDLYTLLQVAMTKGKPVDDKLMTMEKMIAITASLPPNSKSRKRLTQTIIHSLWDSLEHPPLSYMGEKFEYRTPDGSYNNILTPHIGKAGTPYARSTRRIKRLHGVRPDPGLLFDLLMCRDDQSFKENPAGISSVLFYHATIIVHDIFRTNRVDSNISDTSSYLDLAPLYGSCLEDQLKIRTMERGLLKPDTFHEKRLLAQPPGINVMLIMYNRFHNYVADVLLKINENGRFTLPVTKTEEEKKKALAKQDNDLFQTARLIVGGLYINICLHDYLRGLTNTHHSASTWTLDPRIEIGKQYDGQDVPRGCGNQVSAEFNLLYRFHSIISKRDEKWLEEFLASLFPGNQKPLAELPPHEFLQGFLRYEASINPDPSKREFDGLKRGPDGRFKDQDLVDIMTSSMEDPAGLFGSRMVPKALRVVEILGILQARKWEMASLNEFRSFFGLKKHNTMEDINPDPEIASILRNLYDHPDMVELYPGLFIEEAKPRIDPGCGGCPPYTVGRAVFSDAVVLVRSDRFYTTDYTAATLTNWGMQEVQQDYKVLGGSMFYKLFQRALPGWYPYNSLHIMQPMFTWKMNKQIAEEIGTIRQYTLDGPKKPIAPVILTKHSTICKVLKDQNSFRVPWLPALNDLFPGKKDYSNFMLGGDAPSNAKQRALVQSIIYGPDEFSQLVLEFVTATAKSCLETAGFELNSNLRQVDILRDIAIPVNSRLLGDLFYLDLKGPQNPKGSLTVKELYKHLLNVRVWGFNNNDPGLAFLRRIWAQEGATILTNTTKSNVRGVLAGGFCMCMKRFCGLHKNHIKPGSLRWYGQHIVRQLFANGQSAKEVADIMWLTALAGVGVPVSLFAEILQFFLQPEHADLWEQIQDLVASNNPTTDKLLKQYVLEAQRMVSTQRNLRVCENSTTIDGQKFNKGDTVICLFGPACKDPTVVPNPTTFQLGRPSEAYIHFGFGAHECLGKEISLTYCTGLLKVTASLKYLRPAPSDMGLLKCINVGTERCYLDDTWSWLTFDPTTWKLHYEGFGKGVCKGKTVDPKTTNPVDVHVEYEQDCHWFFGPGSHRNPAACMPDEIKPPPLPAQPSPSTPSTPPTPPTQPPQPTQPVPPTQTDQPANPTLPHDLYGLDDVFQQEALWFFGPGSHRNPAACMPDELKPPPFPTEPTQPTQSTQPVPLTQTEQPTHPALPHDLGHLDDVFQQEVLWFFGPESSRNSDALMPREIQPPPLPITPTDSAGWTEIPAPVAPTGPPGPSGPPGPTQPLVTPGKTAPPHQSDLQSGSSHIEEIRESDAISDVTSDVTWFPSPVKGQIPLARISERLRNLNQRQLDI